MKSGNSRNRYFENGLNAITNAVAFSANAAERHLSIFVRCGRLSSFFDRLLNIQNVGLFELILDGKRRYPNLKTLRDNSKF